VVVADKFAVVTGGGDKTPFVIDGSQIALSGDVKIDGSLVVTGTLSLAKLAAGALSVGQYIESANYSPNVSGWRLNANGPALFNTDAIFKGNIDTFGDAVFRGAFLGASQVNVNGIQYNVDYSTMGFGASAPSVSSHVRSGVFGVAQAPNGTASHNVGVIGFGANLNASSQPSGIGVVGQGNGLGGFFSVNTAGGSAIGAANTSTNASASLGIGHIGVYANPGTAVDSPAIHCDGPLRFGSKLIAIPPDNTTTYLRGDGTWAASSAFAEATHTHAIADVTNLQTSLNGKAASSHTHTLNDITPDNSITPSFQFSTDGGATWNAILLKRL
jgi:hypothetical protein